MCVIGTDNSMNNRNSSADECLFAVGAVHPGGTFSPPPLYPTLAAADGCRLESRGFRDGLFFLTSAADEATVRRGDA